MFNVMAMVSSSSYCRPSRLKRKGMPLESSSSSKQQSLLKTHYDPIDDEIDHEDEESQNKLDCYGSGFDFNLCVNCSTPLQRQQLSSTSSGRSGLASRKIFRETKSRPPSPPEATTTSSSKVNYSASCMSIGRSLSDIYNLNYLDHLKQHITEERTKEIPIQNLPLGLCQICGSTLTDLIRLYSDFNSLRKSDSFLSCQISELDQLISQLSTPIIPETSFHDNDNDSDNDSGTTLPFPIVKCEDLEEESQCPSTMYVSSFNYVQCNPKSENNNLDVSVNPGKSDNDNEENSDFEESVSDPLSFSVGPEYEDDESLSEECKFNYDPSSNLSIDFFPYSDQTQTQENDLEWKPIIPNHNYCSERETQISINSRKGTKNKNKKITTPSPSSVSDTGAGTGPTKNSFIQPRLNENAQTEDVDFGDTAASVRVRIRPESKNKRQRHPTDQMRLKHSTFGKDNEETFKCPNCTKEYKLYNSFKSHVLVCSGERLPCKICGKEFRYRSGPFRCMKKHEQELRGKYVNLGPFRS